MSNWHGTKRRMTIVGDIQVRLDAFWKLELCDREK